MHSEFVSHAPPFSTPSMQMEPGPQTSPSTQGRSEQSCPAPTLPVQMPHRAKGSGPRQNPLEHCALLEQATPLASVPGGSSQIDA
jgi:hypothetical protein